MSADPRGMGRGRRAVATSALGMILLGTGSSAAVPDAAAVFDGMERAEARLKDVSFAFTQTTRLKVTGDEQVLRGRVVYLKSPERFVLTYVEPVPQHVAYDGETLTIHFPETGQAFREAAATDRLAGVLGLNPASPLTSIRREYEPVLVQCDNDRCDLRLVHRGRKAPEWLISVDRSRWCLTSATVDNEEMTMRLECHEYEFNAGLKPSDVSLELPAGTEVIEGIPRVFGTGGTEP